MLFSLLSRGIFILGIFSCIAKHTEDGCTTERANIECVFPFRYKGTYYHECTLVESTSEGKAWCAFNIQPYYEVFEDSENWDFCGVGCPKRDTNWIKELGKYCRNIRNPYYTFHEAQTQCLDDDSCVKVLDTNCDDKGNVYLCYNYTEEVDDKEGLFGEPSCLYKKPESVEQCKSTSTFTIVGIFVVIFLILSTILFIYKWKQRKGNQRKDHSVDSPTILQERKQSHASIELTLTENTTNRPNIEDTVSTFVKNKEPSQNSSQDLNNTKDVSKETVHDTSLQFQLTGDPDLIDHNRDIKEQVKVLPYNKIREIPRQAFEPKAILGSGNFGTVYKGILKELDGPNSEQEIAIKTIVSSEGDSACNEFLNEMKIMSYVNLHLNLVNMVGSCTSELNKNGKLWLLIEFCQFGDLKMYLIKNKNTILSGSDCDPINSRCLVKWAYDIVKGMRYLTENNIMHGDLAARNVMIDDNPLIDQYPVAKVADFGLSKNFYDYVTYEKSERLQVPWKWMGIEYLTKGYFTLNSDVWSFAVLIWEMLSFGRIPYGILGFDETLRKLENGYRLPCPEDINSIQNWRPKELYNKLSAVCFVEEPTDRANFAEVVEIIENELSHEEKVTYKKMDEAFQATSDRYLRISLQSAA